MEINTQSNDDIDTLLKQLTPTQEHFLKKYLLEEQLSKDYTILMNQIVVNYLDIHLNLLPTRTTKTMN